MDILKIVIGFALLLGGAEIMVRGAAALALRLGVSRWVVGMTVIAFGTSMPEFLIVLDGTLADAPGLAVGGVVGSNIANILLILGVAGLIAPIAFEQRAMVREAAILLGVSGLFAGLAFRGTFDAPAGVALIVAFLAIYALVFRRAKTGAAAPPAEGAAPPMAAWQAGAMSIGGCAGLIFGADVLVDGATSLARALGVGEDVIGLSLVAFGTSLPELAAAAVAAYRRHAELVLGNILGSNLFNVACIVGSVSLVKPIDVPVRVLHFDIWVMLGAALLLVPGMVRTPPKLGRLGGGLFLVLYGVYIAALVLGVGAPG